MSKKFAEYSQFDLSKVNKDVLKKWDENQVFAKSMTEREGCPSFVFFEGPPSANGMPGIHHVKPVGTHTDFLLSWGLKSLWESQKRILEKQFQ